jgi:hypothetical protein
VSSGAVGDGAPGFSSLDGQNVMENPSIFQDENWGTGPINWKPPTVCQNVFSWLINRNSKKCRFLFGL